MKRFWLLFFLLLYAGFSFAQDILVLKKDESEIKCRILSITDTTITYQPWKIPDAQTVTLKRYEVLSFFVDKKLPYSRKQSKLKNKERHNPEVIAPYHSGEMVEGYVVTTSGDTLTGLITISNPAQNQYQVNFTDQSGRKILYGLNDLRAYGYRNLIYRKTQTRHRKQITNNFRASDGRLFLHLEVDGSAKLYRCFSLIYSKSTLTNYQEPPLYLGKMKSWFIVVNPKGRQLSTRGRSARGILATLFDDDKGMMESIRDKAPSIDELPSMVRSYNTWYESRN